MDTTEKKQTQWSWRALRSPHRVLEEAGTLADLVAQWECVVATLYRGDRPATQREARVAVRLSERMRRRAAGRKVIP